MISERVLARGVYWMLGELTFRGFVFEALQYIIQQVYYRKV